MVDNNLMVQKEEKNILQSVSSLPRHIIFDLESTGLEPFKDRILCITIQDVQTLEVKSFCQDDEQQLLKDFFQEVKDVTKFIGYNNQSFDAPFILQRCLFYGIKLTKNFLNINCQIDLRKHSLGFFLSYNKFQKGKLLDWAGKFGTSMKTNHGSEMGKLFVEKKWKEIEEHCIEDVLITKKLWDRCKLCNVL